MILDDKTVKEIQEREWPEDKYRLVGQPMKDVLEGIAEAHRKMTIAEYRDYLMLRDYDEQTD
jgi:hypothetical protein